MKSMSSPPSLPSTIKRMTGSFRVARKLRTIPRDCLLIIFDWLGYIELCKAKRISSWMHIALTSAMQTKRLRLSLSEIILDDLSCPIRAILLDNVPHELKVVDLPLPRMSKVKDYILSLQHLLAPKMAHPTALLLAYSNRIQFVAFFGPISSTPLCASLYHKTPPFDLSEVVFLFESHMSNGHVISVDDSYSYKTKNAQYIWVGRQI